MKRAVEIAVIVLSGLIVTATVTYLLFEGITTGEVTPRLAAEIADMSSAESEATLTVPTYASRTREAPPSPRPGWK